MQMPPRDDATSQARWTVLQEVFWAARGLPDADRDRYLLSACGDDVGLLHDVRQMLA